MRNTFAFVAITVALGTAAALAQTAPKVVTTPKPAPQQADMSYFVGTWSCIGAQPFSVFGDDHEIQALAVGAVILGDFWLQLRFTELKTGDNDQPGAWTYQIGYDGAAKQYVATWIDNFGGWGAQTSPGWEGNAFVLTGTYNINGQAISARDTFEKANSTTLAHVSELQADKLWTVLESETCHKN